MTCWMTGCGEVRASVEADDQAHHLRRAGATCTTASMVNTLHRDEGASSLGLNEIGWVSLRVTQPLFVDEHSRNRNRLTGGFILVDEGQQRDGRRGP